MVANLVSKRDPKIARNLRISWENWDFPSPKLRFSSLKIQFSSTAFRFPRNPRKSSSTAFRFLQRLSDFFNGFLIFSTAFWFLQRLSDFFNGFPISEKPSSTAFRFLLYCQNTHILNILTFCSKLRNSRIKILRHWVFCQILITIHHTVLQVFKTCMLKWLFN